MRTSRCLSYMPCGAAIAVLLGPWVAAAHGRVDPPGESMSFMVLGERQPGPAAGTAIVEKAVEMGGWLGIDFVVCLAGEPERAALDQLSVPWHAPGDAGEPISFDHKMAHVVLLPDRDAEGTRALREWVRTDLASSDAARVYVFVRRPRWHGTDGGWAPIENVLLEDGRPVSVFAGAERYARDDGAKDNIHYRSVGPAGAFTNLDYEAASFQHVTHVRVGAQDESVALIPIDGARGLDAFDGAGFDALDAFRDSDWVRLDGVIRVGPESGVLSELTIELSGNASIPLDYAAAIDAGPGWAFSQAAFRGRLEPGQSVRLPVHAIAPAIGRARPDVTLTVRAKYPLGFGGEQVVTRRLRTGVEVVGVGGGDASVAGGAEEGVLVLNGRSAATVDLHESPEEFTFEFWAKGREPQSGRVMCAAGSGSLGGFGFYWSDGGEGETPLPVGVVHTARGVVEIRATSPWPWGEWTHVAMCFDGREARLYVGGRLQSRAPARGEAVASDLPLVIGADAGDDGESDDYFIGSLDDVRLSDTVRYTSDFTPPARADADEHTRMLLRFDSRIEGLFPDSSVHGVHAWRVGGAAIRRGDR